jgi:hypothetical protein
MINLSEEYVRIASKTGLLHLTPIHHHLMDLLYGLDSPQFTLENAIVAARADRSIITSEFIQGVDGRIRLLAIRAVEGLVKSGLVRIVNHHSGEYIYEFVLQRGH